MQGAAICHGQEWLAGYSGYNSNKSFAVNENATFVVREHRIEYFSPAFMECELEIRTWLDGARRVCLHHRYEFICKSNGKVIAKGETDWVYINIETGRPMAIPVKILELFPILPGPH